jgi:hypothetical protein
MKERGGEDAPIGGNDLHYQKLFGGPGSSRPAASGGSGDVHNLYRIVG